MFEIELCKTNARKNEEKIERTLLLLRRFFALCANVQVEGMISFVERTSIVSIRTSNEIEEKLNSQKNIFIFIRQFFIAATNSMTTRMIQSNTPKKNFRSMKNLLAY